MSLFCLEVFKSFLLLTESLRFTYKAYRALPSLASITSKLLYLSPLLCLLVSAMLNLDHGLFPVLNFVHVLLILYSFPSLLSGELRFHILQKPALTTTTLHRLH